MAHHLGIKPLRMIRQRHFVDVIHIHAQNDPRRTDVAEQRNLTALLLWQGMLCTTQQDVGLNAKRLQLFNRMLGWLLFLAHLPPRCRGSE